MSQTLQTVEAAAPRHPITRIRRETRRRTLSVETVERITPKMVRLRFASPDLADFESDAPDDHVKLFLPQADGGGEGRAMRDYTPRAFNPKACSLTIDFAVHEAGPATAWALAARPGDAIEIGGPRGSTLVADDFDWVLLIGDETALPAIGRRLWETRPGVPVTTVAIVDDAHERQQFETRADWRPLWVYRDATVLDDAAALRAVLDTIVPPPGDGFVWIAAEGQVARTLRRYMIEQRGCPAAWMKASGYWVRGVAAAHEKIED